MNGILLRWKFISSVQPQDTYLCMLERSYSNCDVIWLCSCVLDPVSHPFWTKQLCDVVGGWPSLIPGYNTAVQLTTAFFLHG